MAISEQTDIQQGMHLSVRVSSWKRPKMWCPHGSETRCCKGDVSEGDRIANPTGNIDRCHTSPSLLQYLHKRMLTEWQAVNYEICDIIFRIR